EMAQPESDPVAVSSPRDHVQVVVGQGRSGGHGQGPSVQAVHAVGVDEAGQVRRAADPGDHEDLVGGDAQLEDGFLEGLQDPEVAASRAPVGMDFAVEALQRQFGCGHDRASYRCAATARAPASTPGTCRPYMEPVSIPMTSVPSARPSVRFTSSTSQTGSPYFPPFTRWRRPGRALSWRWMRM